MHGEAEQRNEAYMKYGEVSSTGFNKAARAKHQLAGSCAGWQSDVTRINQQGLLRNTLSACDNSDT